MIDVCCPICLKIFRDYESNHRVFCSNICRGLSKKGKPMNVVLKEYWISHRSGKDHPSWKGGFPHCLDCKKELKNRYSKRCRNCAFKLLRAENHPNWIGGYPNCVDCDKKINRKSIKCRKCFGLDRGVTPFDKLEREKFQNQMRKRVFERDNYTCQMCGEKGGYLQVDHIQPWKDFVELRFSMDNCRTLCMDCHYFITFGKLKPKNIKTWGHNFKKGVGIYNRCKHSNYMF